MYKEDKVNPFGDDGNGETLDEALFGKLDIPASGAVRIKPVGLDEIRPDLKQPRRAIPQKIRGDWNGNTAKISDLLMKWRIQCKSQTGKDVNLKAVLIGEADLPDEYEDYPGVVESWVKLVRLAQSIQREGLISPITIYEEDGNRYILTGERRYLAYWMLWTELNDPQWSQIPAQVVTYSVRQQVTENTARSDLNAVALARCYAMMVIELYAEEGKHFTPYGKIVKYGDCDRAYYAQVADVSVPYGKGGEVMAAMSVKSRQSINNYKSALSLPDSIWRLADDEDWSMRQILDWLEAQKPEKPQVSRENVQRAGQFDDDSNPLPPALSPLRKEDERYTPPVRVVPGREDQWDDDEDMRSNAPPPLRHEEGQREQPAEVVPSSMEGTVYLLTDTEIQSVVTLAVGLAQGRDDMDTWQMASWLVNINMDELAQYGGDRDQLYNDLRLAVGSVKAVYEELLELLADWQVARILEEFDDMTGGA